MSEMGFGYYTGDLGDGTQDGADDLQQQQAQTQSQPQQQQGNGLRQYLKTLEENNKAMKDQLNTLVAESRRNKVADVLEAKGYDRGAAALYQGDPDKVDDWLTQTGGLLAKRPEAQQGQGAAGQAQQQAAGTVPLEGQAQLQAFQQAGQNAAGPQGTDAEQAAELAKFDTIEKMNDYMSSLGNPYTPHWNG